MVLRLELGEFNHPYYDGNRMSFFMADKNYESGDIINDYWIIRPYPEPATVNIGELTCLMPLIDMDIFSVDIEYDKPYLKLLNIENFSWGKLYSYKINIDMVKEMATNKYDRIDESVQYIEKYGCVKIGNSNVLKYEKNGNEREEISVADILDELESHKFFYDGKPFYPKEQ
jgi:hypothetical protein